ncbi:MAG TPA: class I SAM-dependent methyltransferase [candidate division Zixibacteria bacterium]|nr:class I SAM-dependent methyltransferase [candidate division Zixibacteria bacterium]
MSETAVFETTTEALIAEYLPDGAAEAYLDALLEENERVNLVSRETSKEDLRRLIAESLLPLHFIETVPRSYLDIGSGGGFPAIPLMQALIRQGTAPEAILMEPRQKKSAALRRICLSLGLKPDILKEQFPEKVPLRKFDLITVRLVKITPILLKAALKSLSAKGEFAYFGHLDNNLTIPETACKYIAYRLDKSASVKAISLISKN